MNRTEIIVMIGTNERRENGINAICVEKAFFPGVSIFFSSGGMKMDFMNSGGIFIVMP